MPVGLGVSLGHGLGAIGGSRVVVLDTFNRADSASAIGTGETGTAWTMVQGTWGISSNRAYAVTDTLNDRGWLNPGLSNYVLEVTVRGDFTAGGTYRTPSVVMSYIDGQNMLFFQLLNGAIVLYKRVTSTWTQLATAAQTTASNTDYALRVTRIANVITIFVDGVQKIAYTLSAGEQTLFNPNTTVGFWLDKVGSPTNPARWDSLVVSAA